MKKRVNYFLCCYIGLFSSLFSQKTTIYTENEREFKVALELFEKKKYNAALKSFQNFIALTKNQKSLSRVDAEYYAAACAIELFNKDGEWRMRNFIEDHPESNKIKMAYFQLGKSNYRKKKYLETIKYLENIENYDLNKEDGDELHFKRGYSYLEMEMPAKAKSDLFEIKDKDNKYMHPANYYYSHIAYTEKNYGIALDGFNKLVNNETFGSIVPYYITQIYFIQGKYDEVIKTAPSLLNDSNHIQKSAEINKMIGESYFHKKDYANAIPYLLKNTAASLKDNYQLAYAYYKSKDYKNAAAYFEKSTSANDSLAQNAWYHLADCYLKLQEKTQARSAFHAAYYLSFDPHITEDALFSYARLCYETSYNPYNEAIKSFQKYIKEYPESPRKEEAYSFLVNCFTSTKNYQEAIKVIEKIQGKDLSLKTIYQKMLYFRAIEFFNNIDLDSSFLYFNKAYAVSAEQQLTALAKYWQGDIYYHKKEYSNAINLWKEFLVLPGAISTKEYHTANYNIGYAFFMNKNYDDAQIAFRKYLLSEQKNEAVKMADAQVRTADCYFMKRDYASAAEYYETAIALNKIDVDYSLYHKALCCGLQKNYKEKINDLKMLESKYPRSPYIAPATYEMAEAYNALSEGSNAIAYYSKLITNYPNSAYVLMATKSIGRIYKDQKNYPKSIEYLEKVVKTYPQSPDALDAIDLIKKIYFDKNDPEGLEKYMASIGADIKTSELDESYWKKAAEYYTVQKNCELAMPEMEKYISKFPSGKYLMEAHFCFAECAYSKDLLSQALPHYQFVINGPVRNLHTEVALTKASYILFKDKNYEEALPLYQKLQEYAESAQNKLNAKLGAMRSAYLLKKYDTAIDEANKLLNTEKVNQQQLTETRMTKARSLYETNRKDEALIDLKYLIKNAKSETGAEAYYLMAKIEYDKKELKETEKTVMALIKYPYTNNNWNTRGLLLMADVYLLKGDDQNAEATLQTIIDNAKNQELIDEAQKKLQELKDKEKNRNQTTPVSEMQIEFKNEEPTNNKLFEKTSPVNDSLNKAMVQPK